MRFGFRGVPVAAALTMAVACFSSPAARAGDDGAAPLWVGIGSVFGGFGLGWGKEDKDPINYREHGKIVVPPKIDDLPPPGGAPSTDAGAWPINQETERKRLKKEATRKEIAGQGDARARYTHPFDPNTPVTVKPTDQEMPGGGCASGACQGSSSSLLSTLNPLGWVGLGKSDKPLGPEPDREWLTDPPKGYRAPVGAVGQASN
jgi:hypothetical protein